MSRASIALVVCLAACGSTSSTTTARPYRWDSESSLSIFMKKRINPPFSKLSYLVFHDGDADPAALTVVARDLAAAASELQAWQHAPGDSAQARQVFYEYAAAMKVVATEVVAGIAAGQRDTVVKKFERLREKCDSCHHFFRYGE
jgi:cytochrome c556